MHDRTVSASDVVLALVDLQEGIVNVGTTNDPQRLRTSVAALIDLANGFALPIVITSVPTTGGTVAPLLSEIATRLPHAQPIVRTTSDAFDDAAFCNALEGTGRKTIVFAGIATEVAVRLAALGSQRRGLHAIVAVDACSGLDARTESAAFMALSSAGVELSAVATVAAQLAGDFGSERGRLAMRALQSTLTVHAHTHHDPADDEG